ncbi:hypothetical protein NE237_024228 [Protea cynaroides]|uniref:acylphosphatase n=1 Tax=Protea cynaroides TaxID=273540 RepID=A0A9Q0HE94_9MAGN|nr:hypothetical protein NE237_024228 [Protea cynaroides]
MIKGRVQRVFYRNWTVQNARELGLKGWVSNRSDGSVEALFSDNPDANLPLAANWRASLLCSRKASKFEGQGTSSLSHLEKIKLKISSLHSLVFLNQNARASGQFIRGEFAAFE